MIPLSGQIHAITTQLIQRNKAVQDAHAAVVKAQGEFDLAGLTEKSAKQAVLVAAQRVETVAKAAHERAIVEMRQAVAEPLNGKTRLEVVLGRTVDGEYLNAIVNQLSREIDVEQINHQAGLEAFVTGAKVKADAAVTKASLYGDAANPAPNREDFFLMGILNVGDDKALAAVVDALKGLPRNQTNAIGKIQNITDAYNKVLALANGNSDTADGQLPDAAVYEIIGVTPRLTAAGATILGNVLDGKGINDVDTIAELNVMAAAAQRIAQQGAGATLTPPLKVDDFTTLGINGVTIDNLGSVASAIANPPEGVRSQINGRVDTGAVVNGDSLAAFVAALKLHQPADMDTLAELRELASTAHTALNKIRDYAQSAADGVVAPANSAGLPSLQDFKAIGVTGVDRFASITPDRPDQLPEGLFALLSSLASAAISGAEAATHTQIQQIVDSYNKVLTLADGTANLAPTDSNAPVATDYTRIGSNLGNVATKPGYLTLLNSVIDPLTAQKIDTPAEITALADKVSKVLGYAGSISVTAAPAAPQRDDFTGLGITGLDAADLPAVLARLSRIDNIETANITRLAGLQEMVTKAVQAQAKVRHYADSNAPADAPTLQDYLDMGVPMPIHNEINGYAALMLGALNSTLAAPGVTRAQANTPQQLEAILALYHGKLLPMADGRSNTAPDKLLTVADLDLLGVNTTQLQLTEAKHLRLFNDMVDNMPDAASVANVGHLNVLAARAAKIIAIADQVPGDPVADANKFSVEDYRYFIGQNAAVQPLDEVAISLGHGWQLVAHGQQHAGNQRLAPRGWRA